LGNQLKSIEVSWTVDEIKVYGTITRPSTVKPELAVVFVAGSGPTDRDWCSPLIPGRNCSAKLLAEELAQNGILSLRYDKRASGPHVRENLPKMIGKISMQSHLDELSGAVSRLSEEPGVDPVKLIVLTSSEGMIHALNYQTQEKTNRFAGLVFTGAPGRSIGDLARTQIYGQFKSQPNVETIMKHYDEAVSAFLRGKTVQPDPGLPDLVKMTLQGLNTPANLPFSRELWTYNPSESIVKVVEPMLIQIGKKDVQADWKLDGGALEEATANKGNVTFSYPEKCDHVLKHEETPREKLTAEASLHYNDEGRTLDREAVDTIISWLLKKNNT
jgi:hypothetical protein